jgi:hypothetical protein
VRDAVTPSEVDTRLFSNPLNAFNPRDYLTEKNTLQHWFMCDITEGEGGGGMMCKCN